MKQFRRAIRDSFHHWPTLALATLCSFGIAALWGGNIGALFPVINMTLNGKSFQSWCQQRVDERLIANQALVREAVELQGDLTAMGLPLDLVESPSINRTLEPFARDLQRIRSAQRKTEGKLAWERWTLAFSVNWLPSKPFPAICAIMAFLVFSTLVKHLLMLANDLLIGNVSTSIVRSLRLRIFDRALSYDRKTFQSIGTSGLLATITNTCEALSHGLMNFFGAAVREPLRISVCLMLAGWICWRLLFLSLVLAPLLILAIAWFNRRIKTNAALILGRNASFHEVILESLSNIFTVQAYTMEDHERLRFQHCTKDMRRFGMNLIFYTGLSKPVTELIGVGMIAITVCVGSYLVVNQQTHLSFLKICDEPLGIDSLMTFFGLLIGASDPLRKLGGVGTSIFTGAMAAEGLYGILDQPVVLQEPVHPKHLPKPHNVLRLDHIAFHYDESNPVLKDVDMTIPFGQTVAIVGSNGSGKSTMIQLLCRFYDPTQGSISIDGIDFRDLAIADLRSRVTLVSQNTELFNRTVLENICYGSPGSTREQAIEAAKQAHAHDFIVNALRDGYETVVGQAGQRLSGGQRQRIALARAILRKPEILILDESTSQIDMASELQIRQTLADMKGQFTIIIITHREALVALADAIFEIESGCLKASQYNWRESA